MITTSSAFMVAARANPRKCKAKLDVIWTDATIDPSIVVTTNDENRAALMNQIYDAAYDIKRQWAHFDYDYDGAGGGLKLNGEYNLMPDESTTTFNQCGWYGATRGDADGEWVTNPILTVDFDARPVLALLVIGENNYDEYPVDFDIRLYSGALGTVLEHTETVENNSSLVWSKNVSGESLNDITKMVLEIKKWSKGNRVVKITEFYTSFWQTIENEDIVKLDLTEERELADGSLPIGNISANEIDITLQNVLMTVEGNEYIDPFFPANTNSLFYTLITKNRKVLPYIGFVLADDSVEYVKLGTFWTGDWDIVEQSAVCNVSARDRMSLLRLAEYKGSTLFQNTSLYDLMETVLKSARADIPMNDLEWNIDTELQSFTIPYAWFPKKNYFNTIKDIVTACMGQAYMSRDDVLIIEGPSALTT